MDLRYNGIHTPRITKKLSLIFESAVYFPGG